MPDSSDIGPTVQEVIQTKKDKQVEVNKCKKIFYVQLFHVKVF